MDRFPTALIYVLIFAAVVLLQYMMRRYAQRQQQDSAPRERVPQLPEEAKKDRAPPSLSSVGAGHFGRAEAPRAASRHPGRRFARRSLMGTRRAAQNAIVIAAIVGPCRALEPHDFR